MNTLTNLRRTIQLGAWLAAGAMCAVPAPSQAQEQPAPPPPQAASPAEPQPAVVIKKESKLVLVDSVVTDKKGNYIRDLTQNDFKVFEDNKEKQVSSFSGGAGPDSGAERRYQVHRSERRPRSIDGCRGFRGLAPHRAEFHGERGRAPRGGVGGEEFVGRCKRTRTGRARHDSVDRFIITGQCRGGFWGAQHAAGGTQPGEESPRRPRPKNGGAVLGRVSADAGKPSGVNGNYRCLQQVE